MNHDQLFVEKVLTVRIPIWRDGLVCIGTLEKENPEIRIGIRGFMILSDCAGLFFGGDAGTWTPDTTDMSRAL